jgi:hypothetical protein
MSHFPITAEGILVILIPLGRGASARVNSVSMTLYIEDRLLSHRAFSYTSGAGWPESEQLNVSRF